MNTLQIFIIDGKYDNSLDMLPESIEVLKIGKYENIINKIPMNIKEIIISKYYKYKENLISLKPNINLGTYRHYILG